jgi:hypothetical protein
MDDLKLEKSIDYIPNTMAQRVLLPCVMRALGVKERATVGWLHKFCVDGLIKPYNPSEIRLHKPSDVRRVVVWELVAKET